MFRGNFWFFWTKKVPKSRPKVFRRKGNCSSLLWDHGRFHITFAHKHSVVAGPILCVVIGKYATRKVSGGARTVREQEIRSCLRTFEYTIMDPQLPERGTQWRLCQYEYGWSMRMQDGEYCSFPVSFRKRDNQEWNFDQVSASTCLWQSFLAQSWHTSNVVWISSITTDPGGVSETGQQDTHTKHKISLEMLLGITE